MRVVWQSVAWAVAIAGLVMAFRNGVEARQTNPERLARAEPIRLPVDLSVRGTYAGSMHCISGAPHGLWLVLESQPPFEAEAEAQDALSGLNAVLFSERAGEERHELTFDGQDLVRPGMAEPGEPWPAFSVAPPPRGEYAVTLEVVDPAPGMAGRRQELVARYQLCGLEGLVAKMTWGVAAVWLVIAAAGMYAGYRLSFHPRRRERSDGPEHS
jgi:hypothetical protein